MEVASRWLKRACCFAGQVYNWHFFAPKAFLDGSKFCSELVAAILKERGITPFTVCTPKRVTPADLQPDVLLHHSGWQMWDRDFMAYLREYAPPGHAVTLRETLMTALTMQNNSTLATIKSAETGLRIALVNCENLVRLGNRPTAAAQLGAAVQQGRLRLEQFSEAKISLNGAPWLIDEGTPVSGGCRSDSYGG